MNTKRAILGVLDEDSPLHVTELADRIDGHPITVDQACARLHKDEHIATSGAGRYYLTDDGRECLEADGDQLSI